VEQADRGHRVELFTAKRKGLPGYAIINGRYTVHRLEKVWMPWDSLGMSNPMLPSLYNAVAQSRSDFVDAHAHLFWTTALAVRAAIDSHKPIITTVHGVLALRDPLTNIAQRLYLLSVGAWALRNSSRVVCLTKSDASEVANLGVRSENIRIVPVAVDPKSFHPDAPRRASIAWVGRLVPEKGLHTLIDALVALGCRRTVPVTIVGDGPMLGNLMLRTHKSGLSRNVTFKGRVGPLQVAKILEASQLFVLPSLKEGLPMTLLEAMASGAAVIASDLPSIREVLGDAGFYFTPGDDTELAEIMLRVLDDSELRRRKARLAVRLVRERFSWDVVLPKLEDVYAEILPR
jgi:phosphatidylinositol alpha-mannosyltransferase